MEDKDGPSPEVPAQYRADIDFDEYDSEEMVPPEWLTELDREILALLGNSMLIMTPALIAKNIDRPRSSVSHRLTTLEAGGLVKKLERGHYQISSEGYAKMVQDVYYDEPHGGEPSPTGKWKQKKILTSDELERMDEKNQ